MATLYKILKFIVWCSFTYSIMNKLIMGSNLHRVFVYGTLKRGEPNHKLLEENAPGYKKFICEAKTKEKYPLIIGTKYNIPFLLHSPGNGTQVRGEIYDVDDEALKILDELEDHPNYYIRNQYEVEILENPNETMQAWIYMIKNFKDDLLKETFYESYSTNGSHGLKYVARYLREDPANHRKDIFSKNTNK